MGVEIHPKAIVHPGAFLDEDVKIGPYAVIEKDVKVGSSTIIGSFAQLLGNTEVGKSCKIYSYAVIGSAPQDLKYKGERTFVTIGDNNIIREFVTINPGTEEGSVTLVGNNNLIMAYSHIAHNCKIGDNNILANAATLAGHVEIEDRVVIGGLVAIHQFCRIGSYSIVGGCSKVVQDIPPFSLCDGHPAKVYNVNVIGLRRAGFSKEKIETLRKAFKIIFFEKHTFSSAREIILNKLPSSPELDKLLSFIASSKRGIAR
ncbi:MAG: acyl-[acyl-carrier-protein]--UDP-N-acetylglucosamine O-acyltransferase [Candidatus Omnitrophota bacterium]|nr:MAG: acyl-[acyl-carrier-protein]--UDP-N-acetylglucosamine O-acyltransferase [Candidatus Omnitrophota bacterium]